MESAQSHRIIFSACFWRKFERAKDNGVETKNQDHISWSRIHEFRFPELLLSSTLHIFEMWQARRGYRGYNKAPWPRIRLSEYRFLNSGRETEEYYPDTSPLPNQLQASWHRV